MVAAPNWRHKCKHSARQSALQTVDAQRIERLHTHRCRRVTNAYELDSIITQSIQPHRRGNPKGIDGQPTAHWQGLDEESPDKGRVRRMFAIAGKAPEIGLIIFIKINRNYIWHSKLHFIGKSMFIANT